MKHIFLVLILFHSLCIDSISQQIEAGVIFWNSKRSLTLNDFKAIADSSTSIKGNNLAITRTGITYSVTTSKARSNRIEIKVYATVHTANSYIKERVLTSPKTSIDYLLNHEQKHFDISEIYAREAVKGLQALKLTSNYTTAIRSLMQKIFKQSEIYQELYDTETNNGRNAEKQKRWDEIIAARLKLSEPYKNKTLIKII